MRFNPDNAIVKLCARGMELEGQGSKEEAKQLFYQAWDEAATPFEKFTAAHYVARHQPTAADKLAWDEKCLRIALTIDDETMKATYPSLYLNIAKCYEDLNDMQQAGKNYSLASSYATFLANDGYGNMIRSGIEKGLARVKAAAEN